MSKGKLFVISGASGVGKSTVLKRVMEQRNDLTFSVSATTRPPRPNEVDGVHYYFVTRETFEDMIQKGEFLEYDEHFGNYYGTPKSFVAETLKTKSVIMEIDVVGGLHAKKEYPGLILVFIIAAMLISNLTKAEDAKYSDIVASVSSGV